MGVRLLRAKNVVKYHFFSGFDKRCENVNLRKNSRFSVLCEMFYVNRICIIWRMDATPVYCGKGCGKCGKVMVFHKQTPTYPNSAIE